MLNIQLYNKMNNTPGYLDEKGNIKNDLNAFWSVTGLMQVTPESRCTYSGLTFTTDEQYGAYYDLHQTFVSSFKIKTGENTIYIPENVYYVRFSLCKQTRINLFSSPLEVGSINNVSGSNEDGPSSRRTKNYLDIAMLGADITPNATYTVKTTKDVKQIAFYYYRRTLDQSIIYNSYQATELGQNVNEVTFTTPNIETLCGMKMSFFCPDDPDFRVMLNKGEVAIPYVPYTATPNDDSNTFSFLIYAEAYKGFRDELYEWIKKTISPNLSEGDLDVIIKLMCYIFGDLSGLVYNLKAQIDPDLAEEAYLKHLGTNIGYEWNNALTADEQRESMKAYIELQKKRGTEFSLKNLIAVFGQTRNSYYSSSDLRGVRIICGGKDGEPVGTADSNDLYPGDIMIEVPAFSDILIDAIDNIRLIGTRLFFTYVIYCGPFELSADVDAGQQLSLFFDPAYWGYDPTIEEFTHIVEEETGSDTINNITDWVLLNQRVENCMANAACAVFISEVEPFTRGFIWNIPGNQRYHGFLLEDSTLKEDDAMYGYGKW